VRFISKTIHNSIFDFFELVKTDAKMKIQVLCENSDASIIASYHHTSTNADQFNPIHQKFEKIVGKGNS